MVMIETFIGMARYLSPRYDDDWSDRLNYLYTPNILLALSALISFKQFGGRPIECMFPNKFSGSWEQYAENYCWSQNTYFVEKTTHVELIASEDRLKRELSYYQWVPFFLLLQAAFFRAPSFIWKYFSNHSGIRLHEVVEKARDAANVEEETKERNVGILVRHIRNALRFRRRMDKNGVVVHKTINCLNFQYSSSFISTVYLFTKLLYFGNVFLQLFLMNFFLKTNKIQWYGIGVIENLLNGTSWDSSGFFPRSAVCDFEVRQVANIQKYSVQCVLVINIFTEKIFIFLWFWFLVLMICAGLTFLQWFILLAFPCFSRSFVSQHLELGAVPGFEGQSSKSQREVKKFLSGYLHRDGVLMLRMVTSHAGLIFGTDLVVALWDSFYNENKGDKYQLSSRDISPITEECVAESPVKKRSKKSLSLSNHGDDGDVTNSLIPMSPLYERKDTRDDEEDK